MRIWTILCIPLSVAIRVSATQAPFLTAFSTGLENAFDFSPLGSLEQLSSEEFTTLRHPLVPDYGVRVKKSSEFCDGTVNAYTGYIDIAARHLFFYFFESRHNPKTDDVIFWTNGGSGCSVAIGLFMESGPCRVTGPNETTFHPYSWNEVANILFIDQPIGAGFSYADFGEYVSTTEEAARDIGAFVFMFFQHFVTFKGRAFHMRGESYGARAVPAYASYIVDQNKRLADVGATPINLKSVMLGNGCSDYSEMIPSLYDMQCEHHSVPPVSDISTCVSLKRMLPRCKAWLQKGCYDTSDPINCRAAYDFCWELARAYLKTGNSVFDVTRRCEGADKKNGCYREIENIFRYLSQPSVQEKLGVDQFPGKPRKLTECNHELISRFEASLNHAFPTWYYLEQLLERNVRVLVDAGDVDFACNWIGNERMASKLEWYGQKEFTSIPLRGWNVTSDRSDHESYEAGLVRSSGPLTFATIHGGGHMAAYDRPRESLELIRRWLNGEEL